MIGIRSGAEDFDKKKYREVLGYLDTYVIGCELSGCSMTYEVIKDKSIFPVFTKRFDIWVMRRRYTDKVYKANGFIISIYENIMYVKENLKFNIRVNEISGLNPYKVAHKLKKHNLNWKKEKEGIWHIYDIYMFKESIPIVMNIFMPYIP